MFETDDWLIKQILLEKDRAAGEKLVDRYYKKIYREVYLKTGDEELAKDLTQESFIQILKNLHMFDSSKASFKTWIITIARHKVIDYMRSRQHHEIMMTEILEDYEQEDSVNLEQQVADRMAAARVENLLETEEAESIDIFRMKAQQGYSFSEVSSATGMAGSSVKKRYYSVVKKLRKELRDYE
jgi:RNA polymerase sigma-70 factor (ECF subfamily)